MNSPNGWQRDTAQRLLIERGDGTMNEALTGLLTVPHAPQVRLQALSTLGLLRALTVENLMPALLDPHPAVRVEALRQSELIAEKNDTMFSAVSAAAGDSDASVRLQAAFSLGAWPARQSEPALGELAARSDTDELIRIAIMSSLAPESALFAEMKRNVPVPKPAALVALKPSSADRSQVIAGFAGVEKLTGDATHGRQVFQTLCLNCHRLRGEGSEVGPDLGMVVSKPVDWLLTAILDPSQAVEPRYRAWTVKLKSGNELTGLLSAETVNNFVLRVAGGGEHAILRTDITAMEPMKLSLMPTGLETALKPQDMADLLRWLRAP